MWFHISRQPFEGEQKDAVIRDLPTAGPRPCPEPCSLVEPTPGPGTRSFLSYSPALPPPRCVTLGRPLPAPQESPVISRLQRRSRDGKGKGTEWQGVFLTGDKNLPDVHTATRPGEDRLPHLPRVRVKPEEKAAPAGKAGGSGSPASSAGGGSLRSRALRASRSQSPSGGPSPARHYSQRPAGG